MTKADPEEMGLTPATFVAGEEKEKHSDDDLDIENLQVAKPKYPWYIVFILGNEFCERFSYYGMKTVLTLYLLEELHFSEYLTTLVYHLFTVFAYFTPVFGALLADGPLGKFNTIFSLSLVYVAGLVLLTLAATPPLGLDQLTGTLCGLLLIGLGTGGIKPVVPAYGGDQFRPGQEKERESFFSVFYFAINAGSLISTFLTPILRSDIPCLGNEGCYPLAFGVPAGLLAIAVVAFIAGRPFYRNLPSKENVLAKVFGSTFGAVYNKIRGRGPKHTTHWMDNASPHYSPAFIRDVKQVLPVLLMFVPLPMFWALFDQQGSRWTLQANKMDGQITADWYLKPDQVQIVNPILILGLIPIFEGIIFPILDKFNIPFKALARMVMGMVLAGVAFVVAALIQMRLDSTVPPLVPAGTAELRFINTANCNFTIDLKNIEGSPVFQEEGKSSFNIDYLKEYTYDSVPVPEVAGRNWTTMTAIVTATNCNQFKPSQMSVPIVFNVNHTFVHSIVLGVDESLGIVARNLELKKKEKPKVGLAEARFVLPFAFKTASGGGELTLVNTKLGPSDKDRVYHATFDRAGTMFGSEKSSLANYTLVVDQGSYDVYFPEDAAPGGKRKVEGQLQLLNGGVYTIILKETKDDHWTYFTLITPSSLSVLWQLPQYFIMTLGEVLFSVSGLSFAYSQAPTTMKSVLQAAWLLTVAFGNVIVIAVSGAEFGSQTTEFFIFAGLIGVFAVIFAIMCRRYVYVENKPVADEDKTKTGDSDSDL